MTNQELLITYRAKVLELEELHYQIERTGTDGCPSGCRAMMFDGGTRGTNVPAAAANQLADGLEEFAARKEAELQEMSVPVGELLRNIPEIRTYLIIQHYYVFGRTDEQIARIMCMSRSRVHQLRNIYLKTI